MLPGVGGQRASAAPSARAAVTRASIAQSPAQASALAASTGEPVEILPDRTDFSETYAEPDGGFVESESLVPQQVQQADGSWIPIDTTLSIQPDGLVAPAAITTGLTLSDGGLGPLFTLSQGDQSLGVSWPFGSLPVPELAGATATYSDVLPGVNLLVSATPTGVSDVIEVTSASAAANPDLTQITFPTSGSGLAVTADAEGNLTASDSAGTPVFTAPAPQMWDSAGVDSAAVAQAASQPDASTQIPLGALGPVAGDAQAAMSVAASTGAVSVTPATNVLAGSSVVYPVFIDPTWNTSQSSSDPSWSDVYQTLQNGAVTGTGHDWEASNPQGGIRSGVSCDDSDQSTGACISGTQYEIYRSFLNFPTPPNASFNGATWADAWLSINESYAWGCQATAKVTMYDTASSGSNVPSTTSTTWANQPATGDWLDSNTEAHGYDTSCLPKDITLQAKQAAQAAASGNWSWLTLRLSATSTDETNLNQWSWKNFQASGSNGMVLNFAWRNAPNVPTDYGTQATFEAGSGQNSGHDCQPDNSSTPDYVDTQSPTWQATIGDPDGSNGGSLQGDFNWDDVTTGNSGTVSDPTNRAPGSQFTVSRTGTAGDQYKWQTYGATLTGSDGNPNGNTYPVLDGTPTFPWCYFTIDTGHPEAPQVSTSWTSSNPIGSQATFSVAEPSGYTTSYTEGPLAGKNDVVGYLYGIDNSTPSVYVPASSMGSSGSINIVPFTPSEIDLYVQAVGAGGNPSTYGGNNGVTEYEIDSAPSPGNITGMGWWILNNNGNPSTGDPSEALSQEGQSGFGCGNPTNPPGYTCSLSLPGANAHVDTRPVVAPDGSFTVSAWANPAGCEQTYCAVLSEGASNVSIFTVGYQKSGSAGSSASSAVQCPCWLFAMAKADSAGDEYDPGNPSGSGWYVAAVPASSATGNWTQLTGVFNASHGQILLYVDGGDVGLSGGAAGDADPAATASASPWSTEFDLSYFRIGADWTSSGGNAHYFDGSVSDACAFYGVLETSDLQALYNGNAQTSDGCDVVVGNHQPGS